MHHHFMFRLWITLISLYTLGCGRSAEDIPEPPADIQFGVVKTISGPLARHLEAIPGDYSLVLFKNPSPRLPGYHGFIKVKFRVKRSKYVSAGVSGNRYGPGLKGRLLDADGQPTGIMFEALADVDLAYHLDNGSNEAWMVLRLTGQDPVEDKKTAIASLDKFRLGKKISFDSEIVEERTEPDPPPASTGSGSGDSQQDRPSGGSASSGMSDDCTAFLDGYEAFVNDYINVLRKYKNNPSDLSILNDYTRMATKAQEWANKQPDCTNQEFLTRLAKIQATLASAATNF